VRRLDGHLRDLLAMDAQQRESELPGHGSLQAPAEVAALAAALAAQPLVESVALGLLQASRAVAPGLQVYLAKRRRLGPEGEGEEEAEDGAVCEYVVLAHAGAVTQEVLVRSSADEGQLAGLLRDAVGAV
jgi:hypothetical protein